MGEYYKYNLVLQGLIADVCGLLGYHIFLHVMIARPCHYQLDAITVAVPLDMQAREQQIREGHGSTNNEVMVLSQLRSLLGWATNSIPSLLS